MADYRYSLGGMSEEQRRRVQKLNNVFSPIPITVTDQEIIIGFGDETDDCTVWRDLYRILGHNAHCV